MIYGTMMIYGIFAFSRRKEAVTVEETLLPQFFEEDCVGDLEEARVSGNKSALYCISVFGLRSSPLSQICQASA